MMEVPVYSTSGEKIDTLEIDESVFGRTVNVSLVKQAVVAYQANQHQGTAATRGRGQVSGSTKKLFRQKGTGNARRGQRRTNVLKGGGVAFAKTPGAIRKTMPRKMRRAALASAILAKVLGEDLVVVDGLSFDAPRTCEMVAVLDNLAINRSCLLALARRDVNIYLSSRNIADLTVRITAELNAAEVATRQKMLVTREAMQDLMGGEAES
jgi:large subunit ribosomal protein L4